MSKLDDRSCYKADEESPSSAGQECWVIPSEGDFKESATERYRAKEIEYLLSKCIT